MDFDDDDQPDIRKHKILILETKLEILKRLAKGESGATLAKQYGVSKSTVSEIKRKRDVLLEYTSNLRVEDGLKKRKTIRRASNIALEKAVYRWFLERREAGDPISGPLICEKALEINSELNGSPEFKASSGWLKNFKTRHNIKMQDLIIADITARVARNKLKEQCGEKVGESNGEVQCSDSVVRISTSDSERDSQLSCDRTSLVDPEQEISDAISSILQSPEHQISDNDDQEYSVLFPTVTTVLSPSDQENSNSVGEYTESYLALHHSLDQDNSGTEEDPHLEVVHLPDQGHPEAVRDLHPEVIHLSDNESEEPPAAAEDSDHEVTPVTYSSDIKNSEAVEEGFTVPYPLIKSSSPDPKNSDALEERHTNSYPIASILPDLVNSDAVKEKVVPFITVKADLLPPNHSNSVEGCAVPYAKVRTDLLSPNESNCVQRRCSNSYPVTSILPDLDIADSSDVNRAPVKIEIKEELPDVVDGDHMTEEDSGPSDGDALIALDTAINWLERQADNNPSHLSTLRSIREYAIYKERLSSHPLVPNVLIP